MVQLDVDMKPAEFRNLQAFLGGQRLEVMGRAVSGKLGDSFWFCFSEEKRSHSVNTEKTITLL